MELSVGEKSNVVLVHIMTWANLEYRADCEALLIEKAHKVFIVRSFIQKVKLSDPHCLFETSKCLLYCATMIKIF